MTDGYVRRWQVATTLAIVVLSVAATSLGLFVEGFYRDPYALVYQAYGQDTVTLLVIVPLLVVGLWYASRGSLRGYFVWLGGVGYALYTYAVYAIITEFNPFFLGYVALFGLSLYTFLGGLFGVDPREVKARLDADLPVGLVSWVLVGMGVLVALLWLSEAIPATIANEKPASIVDTGLPANVVHVLDLGVLIPGLFVTARWLRAGRPWGYVLAGVVFVKLSSIGLAIIGMIVWLSTVGQPVEPVQIVVFAVLTVANGALGVTYLLSIAEEPAAADPEPPAEAG